MSNIEKTLFVLVAVALLGISMELGKIANLDDRITNIEMAK